VVLLEIQAYLGVTVCQVSISDVLKVCSTFIFRVKQPKKYVCFVGSSVQLLSGKGIVLFCIMSAPYLGPHTQSMLG
jgi:hypothetical protein